MTLKVLVKHLENGISVRNVEKIVKYLRYNYLRFQKVKNFQVLFKKCLLIIRMSLIETYGEFLKVTNVTKIVQLVLTLSHYHKKSKHQNQSEVTAENQKDAIQIFLAKNGLWPGKIAENHGMCGSACKIFCYKSIPTNCIIT